MGEIFTTGIRPAIDEYLAKKQAEVRDYGNFWSASGAGYCMRLQILRRLEVPPVPEMADKEAGRTRIFEAGHIFHEWIQRITKAAGLSLAQELELQDDKLLIRGHIDDLILIQLDESGEPVTLGSEPRSRHLLLYDYKTAHSAAFDYKKGRPAGHYHTMQVGTYLYMLRSGAVVDDNFDSQQLGIDKLTEARIMSISKDDLRLHENQIFWTDELKRKVLNYWQSLNQHWKEKTLPPCSCHMFDGGFMARRSKKGKIYNDYFYNEIPCSIDWVKLHQDKLKGWNYES